MRVSINGNIQSCWLLDLPSGKRLHNCGTSPFLMGKLTISMAIFNSYVSLPGRVSLFHGKSQSKTGIMWRYPASP